MKGKKGISKIALVILILVVVIFVAVGTFLAIWLIQKSKTPIVDVKLYEDYVEGEGFVAEDGMLGTEMTPLAERLKEYRNDELGIRFGYLDGLSIPEDEETEDGTNE